MNKYKIGWILLLIFSIFAIYNSLWLNYNLNTLEKILGCGELISQDKQDEAETCLEGTQQRIDTLKRWCPYLNWFGDKDTEDIQTTGEYVDNPRDCDSTFYSGCDESPYYVTYEKVDCKKDLIVGTNNIVGTDTLNLPKEYINITTRIIIGDNTQTVDFKTLSKISEEYNLPIMCGKSEVEYPNDVEGSYAGMIDLNNGSITDVLHTDCTINKTFFAGEAYEWIMHYNYRCCVGNYCTSDWVYDTYHYECNGRIIKCEKRN